MKILDNAIVDCLFKGADSGKDEHLEANKIVANGLWVASFPIVFLVIFLMMANGRPDLIQFWWITAVVLFPHQFRFHEVWASPDRDLPCKGFIGFYWGFYANARRRVKLKSGKIKKKKIVRHRGILSHTLIVGSLVRFCIAYWLPILSFVLLWNERIVWAMWTTKDILLIQYFTFPEWAGWIILFWYIACVLSDFVHVMCDRMNPIQFLFTGDTK